MDKIVILIDSSEGGDILIACLCKLFPECEIQVRSKQIENPGDVQVASWFDTVNTEMGK